MDSRDSQDFANPFDGLNPKQVATIQALTTSKTFTDAATEAGVTRETVRLWLREPLFRNALRSAKSEMFDSMSLGLMKMADKAMAALDDILDYPAIPGSAIRRAAANDILGHATKLHEVAELADRIAAIEARLSEDQ